MQHLLAAELREKRLPRTRLSPSMTAITGRRQGMTYSISAFLGSFGFPVTEHGDLQAPLGALDETHATD